jgi:hypothetical protein
MSACPELVPQKDPYLAPRRVGDDPIHPTPPLEEIAATLDPAPLGATRQRLEECPVTRAGFENASFRAELLYQGLGQRRRRLEMSSFLM